MSTPFTPGQKVTLVIRDGGGETVAYPVVVGERVPPPPEPAVDGERWDDGYGSTVTPRRPAEGPPWLDLYFAEEYGDAPASLDRDEVASLRDYLTAWLTANA